MLIIILDGNKYFRSVQIFLLLGSIFWERKEAQIILLQCCIVMILCDPIWENRWYMHKISGKLQFKTIGKIRKLSTIILRMNFLPQ